MHPHLHDGQDLFPGLVEDVVRRHIRHQNCFPALSGDVYLAVEIGNELLRYRKVKIIIILRRTPVRRDRMTDPGPKPFLPERR